MSPVFKSDFAYNRITEYGELTGSLSGKHLNVGRIILGHHIASRHAIAAVVASGTLVARPSQGGFAHRNHPNAELGGAALNDAVGATQRHGWEKQAIR